MVRSLSLHQTTTLSDTFPVWFLGVDVTSAWIDSKTATNTISGTSMAAPYVLPSLISYDPTHLGLPPSGVAGILLTHLGDNGQSTRTYPLSLSLSRVLLIRHILQRLPSALLSSLLLPTTSLVLLAVRPRNAPFLFKRPGLWTTNSTPFACGLSWRWNVVYQVYLSFFVAELSLELPLTFVFVK